MKKSRLRATDLVCDSAWITWNRCLKSPYNGVWRCGCGHDSRLGRCRNLLVPVNNFRFAYWLDLFGGKSIVHRLSPDKDIRIRLQIPDCDSNSNSDSDSVVAKRWWQWRWWWWWWFLSPIVVWWSGLSGLLLSLFWRELVVSLLFISSAKETRCCRVSSLACFSLDNFAHTHCSISLTHCLTLLFSSLLCRFLHSTTRLCCTLFSY